MGPTVSRLNDLAGGRQLFHNRIVERLKRAVMAKVDLFATSA